jgi:hypothetical protein
MHTGTWAGRRGVGPRTTAHVLDFSQIGALRQPGPHMLGPLSANVVAVQAGVRPFTQSVTHTDTDRGNEATQGYTHTHSLERHGPRQIHIHGRPVPTWSNHTERKRDTQTYLSISLIQAHAHIHT